ncbi:MAG: superoxide dismutase, Ni [Chthoniobacterales bacterium]|nr:superoxide dismutase, Ni [Chthoniobacterales bacterium]
MNKNRLSSFVILFVLALLFHCSFSSRALAHCQIPCGIFHDDLVFATLAQNIETLQKADAELEPGTLSSNQSVRWILNKETQADQIAQTMLTYFLQQRVKMEDPKRSEKLNLIAMICMQCAKVKQTVDTKEVAMLGKEIEELKKLSGN